MSLVFPLPTTYREKLRQIDGVSGVSGANWFGGVYISSKNFFPQFAVDPEPYFALYPEYRMPEQQFREFVLDRKGAIVGRKLAETYGWKLGDVVPLRGTIYPGNWEFVIRAIYDGRDAKVDTSQFFFHWDYLNERVRKLMPRRADSVGVYVLGIADPDRAAELSQLIDAQFRNSLAETLTETEKAFQLGFVSMVETLVVAIRIVSYLVIFIIMAVMANTMAMSARERLSEYATLKALGFKPWSVGGLIVGESLAIALVGGALGAGGDFSRGGEVQPARRLALSRVRGVANDGVHAVRLRGDRRPRGGRDSFHPRGARADRCGIAGGGMRGCAGPHPSLPPRGARGKGRKPSSRSLAGALLPPSQMGEGRDGGRAIAPTHAPPP